MIIVGILKMKIIDITRRIIKSKSDLVILLLTEYDYLKVQNGT